MFNARTFFNSRPDGFGVLEIATGDGSPRSFVPLRRTDLTGEVAGPLASLALSQTFALDGPADAAPIEALYRFPLPGDAAVTGVTVRFGDAEIRTALKERAAAEADYDEAKRTGRQAALVTRESPDVFTLAVAGIRPGQEVVVRTEYVQHARPEGGGWSLRVPLTTAPRYVRSDETGSRHADGQPLAVLRDPGHRFALDVAVRGAGAVASPTHALAVDAGPERTRVRLEAGEVVPDRDCVLTWKPAAAGGRPDLRAWVHADPAAGSAYFLALCSAPAKPAGPAVAREVVLLVDHSGSMEGAKWEAADWAVERFLTGLAPDDTFALGLFHNTTRWFDTQPRKATADAVRAAVEFLRAHKDAGGTELGVALEQALGLRRSEGTPARHVLVITDAEVSDAGRILRLADREAGHPKRRRVSVLCIDAAPNAGLADELAARGGGVSRFLTSDPNEDDIATALDEVLADWAAPVAAGLTLEVNRPAASAAGRTVAVVIPGPSVAVDVGDLPAGRPVWVAGRVPLTGDALAFRVRDNTGPLAECRPEAGMFPAVKALFGADRLRRLEYLAHSGITGDELRAELARLGFDAAHAAGGGKVYAENDRADADEVVRDILVRESLACGLPCSETAFVAVRSEAGKVVGGTVVVANAAPAGWQEGAAAGGYGGGGGRVLHCLMPSAALSAVPMAAPPAGARLQRMAPRPSAPAPATDAASRAGRGMASRLLAAASSLLGTRGLADSTKAGAAPPAPELRVAVAAGRHASGSGAVLFDSAAGPDPLPEAVQLSSLAVVFPAGVTLDPGLTLLVFVGDPTTPRAKVRLADVLRQGGRRPLNVRREAGQAVRLVLEDPAGAWAGGVPAFEIVLGWTA